MIYIVLILCSCFYSLVGEDYIGFNVGYNNSSIDLDVDELISAKIINTESIFFGLLFETPVFSIFGLNTGVSFVRRGADITDIESYLDNNFTNSINLDKYIIDLSYIEFSVKIRTMLKKKLFQPYFISGVNLGLLVSNENNFDNSDINEFATGMNIGAGVEKVFSNIKIQLQAELLYGLSDVFSSINDQDYYHLKNRGLKFYFCFLASL